MNGIVIPRYLYYIATHFLLTLLCALAISYHGDECHHHELDGCKYSLYSDLPKLRSQLNPKAFTEILSITGGTTESSPCEGRSHHGFQGVESEVILKIVSWITARAK